MIKILSKLRIKGNFLNPIKGTNEKPTVNGTVSFPLIQEQSKDV